MDRNPLTKWPHLCAQITTIAVLPMIELMMAIAMSSSMEGGDV
jgi:hypothetical protein